MIRHLPIFNAQDYEKSELANIVDLITQELINANGNMYSVIKDDINKLNN